MILGGQESLRQSWSTYYANTDFVVLVVDSSDRDRLAVTKEEFYRMLAHDVSTFEFLRVASTFRSNAIFSA